jgi:hypothetical protein
VVPYFLVMPPPESAPYRPPSSASEARSKDLPPFPFVGPLSERPYPLLRMVTSPTPRVVTLTAGNHLILRQIRPEESHFETHGGTLFGAQGGGTGRGCSIRLTHPHGLGSM